MKKNKKKTDLVVLESFLEELSEVISETVDKNLLIGDLQKLLADEITLFIKAKNYHWNVTGLHFRALHSLFDEISLQATSTADEIAERLRALEQKVPANLDIFAKNATLLQETKTSLKAEKMIANLISDYQQINSNLEHAIIVADTTEDIATSDLLTGFLGEHQKMIWILRSHLQ